MSPRYKILVYGIVSFLAVWVVAFGAYHIAANRKVTVEKVRSYAMSVDLSKLSAADRAKAIAKLAGMLNALSYEERREARLGRAWETWFAQMTDAEKAQFIELTMPTGFKQSIAAFEKMPVEKRQRAVDDALRNLKEAQTQMKKSGAMPPSTNGLASTNGPALSEDLRKQIATIGFKTFYSDSSAQTKAELAPVMEEMQRMMENGQLIFGGGRRDR
jgi:hypothetical protein